MALFWLSDSWKALIEMLLLQQPFHPEWKCLSGSLSPNNIDKNHLFLSVFFLRGKNSIRWIHMSRLQGGTWNACTDGDSNGGFQLIGSAELRWVFSRFFVAWATVFHSEFGFSFWQHRWFAGFLWVWSAWRNAMGLIGFDPPVLFLSWLILQKNGPELQRVVWVRAQVLWWP